MALVLDTECSVTAAVHVFERAFEREIEREIERTSFERAFERWDHIHAGKLLTEAKIRHTWVVSQHRRALVVVEKNLFHSYRQKAEE